MQRRTVTILRKSACNNNFVDFVFLHHFLQHWYDLLGFFFFFFFFTDKFIHHSQPLCLRRYMIILRARNIVIQLINIYLKYRVLFSFLEIRWLLNSGGLQTSNSF